MTDEVKKVALDIARWFINGDRPDEWKLKEWAERLDREAIERAYSERDGSTVPDGLDPVPRRSSMKPVSLAPEGGADIDPSILAYVKGMYGFLESTAPDGFAIEVFRLPPSPTRAQREIFDAVTSDAHGEHLGLARQDQGDRREDRSSVFPPEGGGLTDEGINELADSMSHQPWGIGSRRQDMRAFARAIEREVLSRIPEEGEKQEPIACAHKDTLASLLEGKRSTIDPCAMWPVSKAKWDDNYVPLYAHPPSFSGLAEQRRVLQMALDALEMAHAGLEWYRDRSNEVNDSDDEADEQIGAAMGALVVALRSLQSDNSKEKQHV